MCFRLVAARIHQCILAGVRVVVAVTWVVVDQDQDLIIEVRKLNFLALHFVNYVRMHSIKVNIFF